MNETDRKLEKETEKWLDKLNQKLEGLNTDLDEMDNVYAYRDDTKHFLEKNDYIRAWESIIYAWGIFETLERLGKFESPTE